MTSISDRWDGKGQPKSDDFVVFSNDQCDYFEVDIDKINFLPFSTQKFLAEQLRLPNWEKMDRKELRKELASHAEDLIYEPRTVIGKEVSQPIPIYLVRYRPHVKRIIRFVNGIVDGLDYTIDDKGNLMEVIEVHNKIEAAYYLFTLGKLKERSYGNEIEGLYLAEEWVDGELFETIYKYDGKEITENEYLRILGDINRQIGTTTEIPRDVVVNVLGQYHG